MAEFERIDFHGEEVWLHGAKLLWMPQAKLLCAGDIHLEKGSFFSRFSTLLPPYDAKDTLANLARWIHYFRPDIFVALGDSFHDAEGASRLGSDNKAQLLHLIASVPQWIWIAGNHDAVIDPCIPGERRQEWSYNGIEFLHELNLDVTGPQVTGHYHPKAAVTLRGIRISSPCFLLDGKKLILPSFGTFTGGLDVDSPELLQHMPMASRRIFLTRDNEIYPLSPK